MNDKKMTTEEIKSLDSVEVSPIDSSIIRCPHCQTVTDLDDDQSKIEYVDETTEVQGYDGVRDWVNHYVAIKCLVCELLLCHYAGWVRDPREEEDY
jgi:hypothetical protein